MLNRVLSFNPWIEVFFKWAYWKSTKLRTFLQKYLKSNRRSVRVDKNSSKESYEELKSLIQSFNISPNDILLVHSSFTDLQLDEVEPLDLINFLKNTVVPNGTLVLPAMPIMKTESGKIAEYPGEPDEISIFDIDKSPPWTGVLPRKLTKFQGAKRWWNPINNVVAIGAHADEMISVNFSDIDFSSVYPSGEGSPWEYMMKRNAKIISLGTDLVHSLTMIHTVEDLIGINWPIKNWYRKRQFILRSGSVSVSTTLNERDPKWAINFAERTLNKDLLKNGLLVSKRFNNSKVEYIGSKSLADFLVTRNKGGYPYFTLSSKSD